MHIFSVRNINLNCSNQKQAANPEEQIIKSRGRRELPRTPVRKSPRKRNTNLGDLLAAHSGPERNTSPQQPLPQESPFTKCLRSMNQSPPRATDHRISTTLRKRLLMSPEDSLDELSATFSSSSKPFKKVHYYSPISRKLRSSDASDVSSLCFDDSGVDMTSPDSILDLTGPVSAKRDLTDVFDTMSVKSSVSSCSDSSKKTSSSVNRARRRFRFWSFLDWAFFCT